MKNKLYKIIKNSTGLMVDIVWADNEAQAVSEYIKRQESYWGFCAYKKDELHAVKN